MAEDLLGAGAPPPDAGAPGAATAPPEPPPLHATCVALPGPDGAPCAALIRGASGTGKSRLALEMLARGACLVADDRTRLRRDGARVVASAPAAIAGLVEARGLGLLPAPTVAEAPLVLVVDLDHAERDRLPPQRETRLLGVALPLIHAGDGPWGRPADHAAALCLLLRAGGRRAAP